MLLAVLFCRVARMSNQEADLTDRLAESNKKCTTALKVQETFIAPRLTLVML